MCENVQFIMDAGPKRKVFKLTVFILCTVGFVYQFYEFILFYLTYPTTLESFIKYTSTENLPKPVITVCDQNNIRRTDFCKSFPKRCYKAKNIDEFCKFYQYSCVNRKIIKEEDMMIPRTSNITNSFYNRTILEKYGMKVEDVLKLYRNNTGEILLTNENRELVNCYTLDLAKFNKIRFKKRRITSVKILGSNKIGNILINFNLKDLIHPYEPGIKISVHSKDKLANPFIDGFLVKPGRKYIVQLKPKEHHLLKNPFNTNCTTYNVTNDVPYNETYNQERCIIECKKLNWLKQCGCMSIQYPFRYDGKYCNADDINCLIQVNHENCYHNYRTSCKFIEFSYEVSNSPNYHINYDIPEELSSDPYFSRSRSLSEMTFIYKSPGLLISEHKPRLNIIEIFSFAGGYIGIWLGISLYSVIDFFEWLTIYIYYKRKKEKAYINNSEKLIKVLRVKNIRRY